ncbi:hypothetical protein MRX96_051675, partial [Rhipicephalus microplus]
MGKSFLLLLYVTEQGGPVLLGREWLQHVRLNWDVVFSCNKLCLAQKPTNKEAKVEKELPFLGHKLSADGIHPMTDKFGVIVAVPAPETKPQLRSLLGALNYYEKFLPQLAMLAHPLYKLLRDDQAWAWTSECETAFDDIKAALVSPEVLAHYDPQKPLQIACDASYYGPPEEEDAAFKMANRILVNSNLPLSDSFRKIGQRVYRTLGSSANLARRSAEERRLVNTWAEAITGIKQVIPPDCPLDGDSRIVLLSSATLDTLWKFPFPKSPMMRRSFGSWPAVPTMGQTAMLAYACIEDLGVRVVELPFSSEAYSATIILPTGKFDDLCVNLTPEVLDRVFEAVKERQRVRIEMPRFSATFEAELTDVLQKLGIHEAFTDEANF